MSTCRCGAWAGGPEAPPYCTVTDCELRGSLPPVTVSDTGAPASSHPCVGAPVLHLVDQGTSDREADQLLCSAQCVAVHSSEVTDVAA